MTGRRISPMRIPWKVLTIVMFVVGSFIVGFMTPANANSPDDLLIVGHRSVNADSISVGELRAIFLKQRSRFSAGGKAMPIHAKPGSALRKAFQLKVLAMDASAEKKYWQDQKIKDGSNAPIELSDTLRAVFSMRGGISYCFRKHYKAGTSKILLTL